MTTRTRSQAPVGKTMPIAKGRLKFPDTTDPERVMMGLWKDENVRRQMIDFGCVPLDSITHECNEKCIPEEGRHHYTGKLDDHDVRIVASTVQWLATNCGRAFLMRFFREIGMEVVINPEKTAKIGKRRKTNLRAAKTRARGRAAA